MNLVKEASALPDAWRSRILGRTGGANLKVIRMDEAGIPFESHAEFDEALLVIEGEMQLEIEGEIVRMQAGDFYIVPAGKSHKVLPGSHGTLFLVDAE
ncbi:MAG TPA: cupin domain-containing protein [Microvirga sp.]|nr:cupin domain-containing protein [Microvirga sp.]